MTQREPGYFPRSKHYSVQVHIKKYLDIDTGKFITDKCEKLSGYNLSDIIDDDRYGNWRGALRSIRFPKEAVKESNVYNFPKFVPKDNDFDKECIAIQVIEKAPEKEITNAMIYLGGPQHGEKVTNICHVKTNKWIPK